MTNWIQNGPPAGPGFYLVTVKTYDLSGRKVVGRTASASWWRRDRWWNYEDDDVIAWAEMPEPFGGEEE